MAELFPDETASPSAGGLFTGPMPLYRAKRQTSELKADPVQELAAEKLQTLHRALIGYHPHLAEGDGWFSRLRNIGTNHHLSRPKGLYLFGGVGRGKSMLMDLFFETSSVDHKRRVHFHAFMQEVHDRLHRLRLESPRDPLIVIAQEIAATSWLLCFDEFQVTDIADAMLIGRLFHALFQSGVVVVATSNRPPDDLYQGGLHRDRFIPFIHLLKNELDILELDNGRDYRLSRLIGQPVYYAPADDRAEDALRRIFISLTDGEAAKSRDIEIKKRLVHIPKQAGRAAWFDFEDLCVKPLGPADFLAIAEVYEHVLISHIPLMEPDRRDHAKRFNILVDILYEAKVHLIVSAATAPELLYPAGDGSFEFQRTVSRLMEMQSQAYLSIRRSQPKLVKIPAEPVAAAGV